MLLKPGQTGAGFKSPSSPRRVGALTPGALARRQFLKLAEAAEAAAVAFKKERRESARGRYEGLLGSPLGRAGPGGSPGLPMRSPGRARRP
mmetsp:Transcript_14669/g.37213  ORF Transcript_14669/g.37213 Transcript_14669/m.37213 type:complete len:91 (+) Transcript_14669:850-1122(+)